MDLGFGKETIISYWHKPRNDTTQHGWIGIKDRDRDWDRDMGVQLVLIVKRIAMVSCV